MGSCDWQVWNLKGMPASWKSSEFILSKMLNLKARNSGRISKAQSGSKTSSSSEDISVSFKAINQLDEVHPH